MSIKREPGRKPDLQIKPFFDPTVWCYEYHDEHENVVNPQNTWDRSIKEENVIFFCPNCHKGVNLGSVRDTKGLKTLSKESCWTCPHCGKTHSFQFNYFRSRDFSLKINGEYAIYAGGKGLEFVTCVSCWNNEEAVRIIVHKKK